MEFFWRPLCLLLALLGLPVMFAAFCIGLSRRREPLLISYLAYYVLLGCVAGWFLAAGLWPSSVSRTFGWFLLTGAPLTCLGFAVMLQRKSTRTGFDTGAMIGCYLYAGLAAAAFVLQLRGGN